MSSRGMIVNPQELGRVGVFMGGWSAEREISLMSGEAVLAGLWQAGVDAEGFDVSRESLRNLDDDAFDRVFLILHGGCGEDGSVQAMLDLRGIPYTGSGVLGSALALDKRRSKLVWQALGYPVPDWMHVDSAARCEQAAEHLGFPLVIKPSREGSSIGVSMVERPEQLAAAFDEASAYGDVIAEKYLAGYELTVGILDGEALPVIHIETPREFYDYKAKYFVDSTHYHCPADIPGPVALRCRELALGAFAALEGRHWGRVDFLLDDAGDPQLLEMNTAPGMTSHSLVPMAALEAGYAFDELLVRILACTLENRA